MNRKFIFSSIVMKVGLYSVCCFSSINKGVFIGISGRKKNLTNRRKVY